MYRTASFHFAAALPFLPTSYRPARKFICVLFVYIYNRAPYRLIAQLHSYLAYIIGQYEPFINFFEEISRKTSSADSTTHNIIRYCGILNP